MRGKKRCTWLAAALLGIMIAGCAHKEEAESGTSDLRGSWADREDRKGDREFFYGSWR